MARGWLTPTLAGTSFGFLGLFAIRCDRFEFGGIAWAGQGEDGQRAAIQSPAA